MTVKDKAAVSLVVSLGRHLIRFPHLGVRVVDEQPILPRRACY